MSSLSRNACARCGETTLHRYGVCIVCHTALPALQLPKTLPYGVQRMHGLKQLSRLTRPRQTPSKRCKECGGPIDSTLTYCGDECRNKARLTRYGTRKRVCPVCGETYRLRGGDDLRKRTCSMRCGQVLRRERERLRSRGQVQS